MYPIVGNMLLFFAWGVVLGQVSWCLAQATTPTGIDLVQGIQLLTSLGSAGAVIYVVILFLRRQTETDAKLSEMNASNEEARKQDRQEFLTHNKSLFDQAEARAREDRADLRLLIDRCIAVTQQVVITVNALDTRVREDQAVLIGLKSTITELQATIREMQKHLPSVTKHES